MKTTPLFQRLAGLLLAVAFVAQIGCRAGQSYYDYGSPVMGGECGCHEACGCYGGPRAGSVHAPAMTSADEGEVVHESESVPAESIDY